MELTDQLAGQWHTLIPHAGAEREGRALLERWAEPHRRYHGLRHLRQVLLRIDELAEAAIDVDAVRLAAFFHDAVYEIGAADNEERSAALAEQVLTRLAVGAERVREVARLVRVTATHVPMGASDVDGGVLCDADLAILGAEPTEYAAYAAQVRDEYRVVPEAAFRRGRAEVLRTLSDRPALFATPMGQARWEAAARRNIVDELRRLHSVDGSA